LDPFAAEAVGHAPLAAFGHVPLASGRIAEASDLAQPAFGVASADQAAEALVV
jgi:hypothetical protein